MKQLSSYIKESQIVSVSDNIDNTLNSIINATMKKVDYSQFKAYTNEQDPNRFDVQKQNEEIIISAMDTDYDVLTTADYYTQQTKKDFKNLSDTDKSTFDRDNGNIIVLDRDKAIYNIDIKISNSYIGAVNLGSLKFFNENGYYLCISLKDKEYKLVSHKAVKELVEKNPGLLTKPSHQYKGYSVEWNGENLTSEYYIKGKDIKSAIK